MKQISFRALITTMLIATALITGLAFYSIGVVDNYYLDQLIDERIQVISEAADDTVKQYDLILSQLCYDSEAKARALAFLIYQNPELANDDIGLEELLAIMGVEEILITDGNGEILQATSTALLDYYPAVDDYSDKALLQTTVIQYGDKKMILSQSARLDSEGIICVAYAPKSLSELSADADIENVVYSYPLLKRGSTAIIDAETLCYLSCTNSQLVGLSSTFDSNSFSEESGGFKARFSGVSCQIRYLKTDKYIILGAVPTKEYNNSRKRVTLWTGGTGVLLTLVVAYIMKKDVQLPHKNEK